jgi:ribose transport system substrate-binding protein
MSVRPRRWHAVRSILVVGVCAVLAACSSGGTSSGSASAGAQAGGGDLTAIKAAVADFAKKPTSIPVSEPLAKKPESGKTMVWMACQLSACALMSQRIQTAVESVGWTYKQVPYDQANPASLVAGMQQALRYNPAYVAMSGVAAESWASVVPAYKAAGVKIVASYLGHVDLTDTIIANVYGENLNVQMGKELADWFIADSNGKGNALLQTVNDYPSNKIMGESFKQTVQQSCPGCHVDSFNVGLADAGQGAAVSQAVSQLRTKPNDNYLVATFLPFQDGLPAALKAAGLEGKVKVAGGYAASTEFPMIHSGAFAAGTAISGAIASYGIVDAALRDATGTSRPKSSDQSQLLLTGGDFPASGDYNMPADPDAQYKKLWAVS